MGRMSPTLLKALDKRDGHACAFCGRSTDQLVPHHRANRGMGGRKSMDRLSNLVWLCSWENDRIEADHKVARLAVARGVKISSHDEPSHVPIRHAVHGLVLLDDLGGVHDQTVVF